MQLIKVSYVCLLALFMFVSGVGAGESSPPLPLHGIEGYGGVAVTYSAYLVNPAAKGHFLGQPSIGMGGLVTDEGRTLGFATITETIGGRLELGYGVNRLDLNDLPGEINKATGINIDDDALVMHNFNARLVLLKEGDLGQSWLPALTFGIHYKYNDSISDIDRDLGGALTTIGIEDNQGIDYTLYASKMLSFLPKPVLVNIGMRSSEAAHIGLLRLHRRTRVVGRRQCAGFSDGPLGRRGGISPKTG